MNRSAEDLNRIELAVKRLEGARGIVNAWYSSAHGKEFIGLEKDGNNNARYVDITDTKPDEVYAKCISTI